MRLRFAAPILSACLLVVCASASLAQSTAPDGLLVRLSSDRRAGERILLPAAGLQDGDILVALVRPWRATRAVVPLNGLGVARSLRLAADDRLENRAPFLVWREGAFLWLPAAQEAVGPRLRVVPLPDAAAAGWEAVSTAPDAAHLPPPPPAEEPPAEPVEPAGPTEPTEPAEAGTPSEPAPILDETVAPAEPIATPSFGPPPECLPVDGTRETIPGLPPDPLSEAWYRCEVLGGEWAPRAGVSLRTYVEARQALTREDAVRARSDAPDWISAYRTGLESAGYRVIDSALARSVGGRRAWWLRVVAGPEDSALGASAPNVALRVIEVGFLDGGIHYRRAAELALDPPAERAALAAILPVLELGGRPRADIRHDLAPEVRAYGGDVIDTLLGAWERATAAPPDTLGRTRMPGEPGTVPSDPNWDPIWTDPEAEDFHAAVAGAVERACKANRTPVEAVSIGLCDAKTGEYGLHLGDTTRYAACVAKLLILLGMYEEEANGRWTISRADEEKMSRMVRLSSMPEAGEMAKRVGVQRMQEIAEQPRYHLYDKTRGGGMWTGRSLYGHSGPTYRDPVANQSQGVSARQVLRWYWMLDHGQLVSPEASQRMARVMLDGSVCGILDHKIVHALRGRGGLTFIRKSGWYPPQQNDSALIIGPGRRYILCCFVRSGAGDQVIEAIAKELDDFMLARSGVTRPSAVRSLPTD